MFQWKRQAWDSGTRGADLIFSWSCTTLYALVCLAQIFIVGGIDVCLLNLFVPWRFMSLKFATTGWIGQVNSFMNSTRKFDINTGNIPSRRIQNSGRHWLKSSRFFTTTYLPQCSLFSVFTSQYNRPRTDQKMIHQRIMNKWIANCEPGRCITFS